jgi:hypothetical protein
MIFGPDLIAGIVLLFIFWGFPIWAIVDAASRTTSSLSFASLKGPRRCQQHGTTSGPLQPVVLIL